MPDIYRSSIFDEDEYNANNDDPDHIQYETGIFLGKTKRYVGVAAWDSENLEWTGFILEEDPVFKYWRPCFTNLWDGTTRQECADYVDDKLVEFIAYFDRPDSFDALWDSHIGSTVWMKNNPNKDVPPGD